LLGALTATFEINCGGAAEEEKNGKGSCPSVSLPPLLPPTAMSSLSFFFVVLRAQFDGL
jgi:hypothetical protein